MRSNNKQALIIQTPAVCGLLSIKTIPESKTAESRVLVGDMIDWLILDSNVQ